MRLKYGRPNLDTLLNLNTKTSSSAEEYDTKTGLISGCLLID